MKTYGHLYGVEESLETFVELKSVVIEVDEPFLVALRDFAQYALDDMRRLGKEYDHVHFQDKCEVWRESWPDIILIRQSSGDAPEAT
ncbi:MAG: hypothetical protein V4673_04150 [Pseudomonadota bacterium]|jgi:hypothetical protein